MTAEGPWTGHRVLANAYRRDHWGRNLPLGVGHAVGRGERLSHGTSPGRTKRAKSWRTLFEIREEPGQGVAEPTGLRYRPLRGRVAQRIEHLASNQRVAGSIPAATANLLSFARARGATLAAFDVLVLGARDDARSARLASRIWRASWTCFAVGPMPAVVKVIFPSGVSLPWPPWR